MCAHRAWILADVNRRHFGVWKCLGQMFCDDAGAAADLEHAPRRTGAGADAAHERAKIEEQAAVQVRGWPFEPAEAAPNEWSNGHVRLSES